MMFPAPSAGHTVGEFGDKFRIAREKKELSLDDVSNVTKISSRMLQAIELEHFDQLPGGVFNKGFIRAYAKHLGLNDEEAVSDYLICLRKLQIEANEIWEPERPRTLAPLRAPVATQKPRTPSAAPVSVKPTPPARVAAPAKPAALVDEEDQDELPEVQVPKPEPVRTGQKHFSEIFSQEIPWRIVAIAAVVLVLGIILWSRRSHNANSTAANAPNTVQANNASSASSPVSQQAAISTPLPATASIMSNSKPASQSDATTPATSPTADPGKAPERDVTVRTSSKPTKTPAKSRVPALTLVIRATETSSISVLADGQPFSRETLIAPAHTSIRADREIVVKIGNAAGVTFLWKGKEIPAEGAESEAKTFVFDANGMRAVPSE
jgi:cytoskeletal protein RodZ